jgi:hypothetical protein
VGINQRVSLRKFIDDIRRWVDQGRSDDWIASALGTSPSSVQSFRSRNAIYRRGTTSTLHDPREFSSYEGVLEPEWKSTDRVELRLTPSRIVLLRRGVARDQADLLKTPSTRSSENRSIPTLGEQEQEEAPRLGDGSA